MPSTKLQWGLIMPETDYDRLDAQAAAHGETRQEYARRVLRAALDRDERRARK